jgi:hypothetical protein
MMGMFDHYQPDPILRCPKCNADLSGWQGKDGPCALFVWKQGEKHPVDQPIDDDVQIDPMERERFTLPETFEIYTSCSQCEQWVEAECRGENYVWTHAVVLDGKHPPRRTESMG